MKVQNFELFIQTLHSHGTTSSLSGLLSHCSSSWIKTSKLCCCIKLVNSNATFYQGSNFQLLRLNFNMWVCIFNITFFFPIILLQIVGATLCFTNLHFMRNNWCCLRHYVACKSIFCPWMFLFWLGVTNYWSTLFAFKLLLMVTTFSTCSCSITWSHHLLKLLITILFSISLHYDSNLNKLMH